MFSLLYDQTLTSVHDYWKASLVAQLVKNLPAIQENQVQSLGWEDQPGEGKFKPLQYSYLENSIDREVRLATVYRISKSQNKRLSN